LKHLPQPPPKDGEMSGELKQKNEK